MTPVQSIQLFVAVNFLAIGSSHLIRPTIWIEFFQYLAKKGNVGNIFNALLALAMGSIIISFHLIWKWPTILVTLYGLSQLLKGFIYLIFPRIGLKSIRNVNSGSKKFRRVGFIMCMLSILLFVKVVVDLNI